MARWLERLSRFNFKIEHRPGRKHNNSDGQSRRPCEGNCRHCMKGHEETSQETVVVRAVKAEATRRPCSKDDKYLGEETILGRHIKGKSRSKILLGKMGAIKTTERDLVLQLEGGE